MTLNASGAISIGGATAGQSINLELGKAAGAQTSLNDSNVRSLAGVASGQISMPANFWGKASSYVQLFTNTYTKVASPPAQIRFTTSGNFQANDTGSLATKYAWLLSGAASDYELFVSPTSGSFSTGTVSTWLNLGTQRDFTRGSAFASVTADYYIRRASDGVVLVGPISMTLATTP